MTKIRKYILLSVVTIAVMVYSMGTSVYAEDKANRLWGKDRIATAIEISKTGWPGTSQNAVLVTSDNYPDALCASPLAGLLGAPILLVGKTAVDSRVLTELQRLQTKHVVIVGGIGVISKTVETTLTNNGISFERLSGLDRYQTSLAVANYIGDNSGQLTEAVVATGENYPDALSIAPIASQKKIPIILSDKDKLSTDVKAYLSKRGITKTYVLGGTGVVSTEVERQLPSAQRLGGADRFGTNLAVLNYFFNDLDFSTTYLTTGNDFPDALAGSVLAGKQKSPIILIDKVPGQATRNFVAENRLVINQMMIIGGTGVVADSSVEPLLPKIIAVNDMNVYVKEGQSYTLPAAVSAVMDNNTAKDVSIVWNPGTADTTKGVVSTFSGTVKGYASNVKLTMVITHPVMGKSQVTAKQMEKFLLDKNPSPNISVTPLELAQLFLDEGAAEGVRGDIAFCQSIHETGWFKFGGLVLPEQNNYAGIGATNESSVGKGAWFNSPRDGVRAQIQHLKAYASKDTLVNPVIDPRYDILKQYNLLGVAPNWEDLSGRWAVPGYSTGEYSSLEEARLNGASYGQSIYKLYEQLKAVQVN